MNKNFISEFIRAKGQEGSGSTERLHAKLGDRNLHVCLIYFTIGLYPHRPDI